MTESPSPNKFAKWKRPLIGGFLSAVIAGGIIAVQISFDGVDFLRIPALSVITPILLFALFTNTNNLINSALVSILLVTALWLIIGFTITYFVRNNLLAIGSWILIHVIFISLAVGLCLICQ